MGIHALGAGVLAVLLMWGNGKEPPAGHTVTAEIDVADDLLAEPRPPEPLPVPDALRAARPTLEPQVVESEPPPPEVDWTAGLPDSTEVAARSVIGIPLYGRGRVGSGRAAPTATGDGEAVEAATQPAAKPSQTAAPVPVASVFEPARAVQARPPTYPERARALGLEGTVELAAEVHTDGSVGEVRVVVTSGSPMLDRAAVAAVRRWTFRAARRDGRCVASVVRIKPIRFVLTAS